MPGIRLVLCSCGREYDANTQARCPNCKADVSTSVPAPMDEDALRIQASPARTKVSSLFPTESLEAKYLKKIHFWVQFLGIVVMVQIAGGLLVLVIVLSSS